MYSQLDHDFIENVGINWSDGCEVCDMKPIGMGDFIFSEKGTEKGFFT